MIVKLIDNLEIKVQQQKKNMKMHLARNSNRNVTTKEIIFHIKDFNLFFAEKKQNTTNLCQVIIKLDIYRQAKKVSRLDKQRDVC